MGGENVVLFRSSYFRVIRRVPQVDAFFRCYVDADLDESMVLPTAAEILARPAPTFELWTRAHAGSFTWPRRRSRACGPVLTRPRP